MILKKRHAQFNPAVAMGVVSARGPVRRSSGAPARQALPQWPRQALPLRRRRWPLASPRHASHSGDLGQISAGERERLPVAGAWEEAGS
jgi:hypothetical protein